MIFSDIKVFIGIPTAELGRSTVFYDYVNGLIKPEGTIGRSFHTNTPAWNRNLIIDEALSQEASHILFIDDDMAFAPDALIRLLKHNKDIISGLYFNRGYPHTPVVYDFNPDTQFNYSIHYLRDKESGLISCQAVGFGFVLINTDVFYRMDKPYVREGEIITDRRCEDIGFCLRARSAGIEINCDLDTPIGHIGQATFWPNKIDGVWHTGIDTCGMEIINVAQMNPDLTPVK